MRCQLLRPGQGEKISGVLLGGLTDFKMHWFQNKLYPCTECAQCPYCPGRPDKTCYRWYGAAALFTQKIWVPSDEEVAAQKLRQRAGETVEPLRAKKICTVTGPALAEIPDAEIHVLGDDERRAMVIEWTKGSFKNSPVKIRLLGRWEGGLMDEFDWLPAAERILNGGQPIRLRQSEEVPDGKILKFRKQA